jgi:hypothetical protein
MGHSGGARQGWNKTKTGKLEPMELKWGPRHPLQSKKQVPGYPAGAVSLILSKGFIGQELHLVATIDKMPQLL